MRLARWLLAMGAAVVVTVVVGVLDGRRRETIVNAPLSPSALGG